MAFGLCRMNLTQRIKELSNKRQLASAKLPQNGKQNKTCGIINALKIFCRACVSSVQLNCCNTPDIRNIFALTRVACFNQSKDDISKMPRILISVTVGIRSLLMNSGNGVISKAFALAYGTYIAAHLLTLSTRRAESAHLQTSSSSACISSNAPRKFLCEHTKVTSSAWAITHYAGKECNKLLIYKLESVRLKRLPFRTSVVTGKELDRTLVYFVSCKRSVRYDVSHVTVAEPKRCEPNARITHSMFNELRARLKSSEITIASFLSLRASASRPERRHNAVSHFAFAKTVLLV